MNSSGAERCASSGGPITRRCPFSSPLSPPCVHACLTIFFGPRSCQNCRAVSRLWLLLAPVIEMAHNHLRHPTSCRRADHTLWQTQSCLESELPGIPALPSRYASAHTTAHWQTQPTTQGVASASIEGARTECVACGTSVSDAACRIDDV